MNTSPPLISLSRPDKSIVGTLEMKEGKLTFSGDADESARIFFDSFIALNNAEMKQLREKNELLMSQLIVATGTST